MRAIAKKTSNSRTPAQGLSVNDIPCSLLPAHMAVHKAGVSHQTWPTVWPALFRCINPVQISAMIYSPARASTDGQSTHRSPHRQDTGKVFREVAQGRR